jgi:succinyl-diaminopimelate desuccinylase
MEASSGCGSPPGREPDFVERRRAHLAFWHLGSAIAEAPLGVLMVRLRLFSIAASIAIVSPVPSVAADARASSAARMRGAYQSQWSDRMVPLVEEAIRFETVAGKEAAFAAQRAWLHGAGAALGFTIRDTGTVTEVELPGPPGSPVIGLAVHGDVQLADARGWTSPPFEPAVRGDRIWGRGSADDKGPMVQALLAMAALRSSGVKRTHTVRLLVGGAEESDPKEMDVYLSKRPPPDLTLVLDMAFPVALGEKAWSALVVTAPPERTAAATAAEAARYAVVVIALEAGIATAIVPDRAEIQLRWSGGAADWDRFLAEVRARPLPEGTRLDVEGEGLDRTLRVIGKAAHAGVALRQGRNALVALAGLLEGLLPPSGASDLLAFARLAGSDLDGAALALPGSPPPWNGFETNVATVKRAEGGLEMAINIRATPALFGEALRTHLDEQVRQFNARTGASLVPSGYFSSTPLVIDPASKLVRRLLAAYRRGGGRPAVPVASPGGTYAKHLPNAVAFGMWFTEDGPYPGHGSDEFVPIASLHAGTHILIEALADLACGPPVQRPLLP